MDFLRQYEFVKSSRKVLLEYCQEISATDFLTESRLFGKGSIRNLLVHICTTYEFWIGRHSLNKNIDFTERDSIEKPLDAESMFLRIDSMVEEFQMAYFHKYMEEMELNVNGKIVMASPLKLFTHVITHEFHHKGQILSLSRHLGYVPVDTDIIRWMLLRGAVHKTF